MKIILAMKGPFRGFRPKDDPAMDIPTIVLEKFSIVIPGRAKQRARNPYPPAVVMDSGPAC
jgi:hypothetical protein